MTDLATLELKLISSGIPAADSNVKALGKSGDNTNRIFKELAKTILGYASLHGAFRGLQAVFQSLSQFERGLADVERTTGIAGASLKSFGDDIIRMSLKIPVAAKELLEMSSVAGQMGVEGSSNILKFAETIARLNITTSDLKGEAAALQLGRLLAVSGEGVSTIDKLASTVLRLGVEFAATEGEIVKVATRISQSTAAFGLLSGETVALGAAMREMGVRAELGGTGIGRLFAKLNVAVLQGGQSLEIAANVAGQSKEAFAAAFDEKPLAGVLSFLEGLGRFGRESGLILDELGIKGVEFQTSILPLVKNFGIVKKAFALYNEENKSGAELARQSGIVFRTLSAAVGRLGNTLEGVKLHYRESTGALTSMVDTIQGAIAIVFNLENAEQRTGYATNVLADTFRILTVASLAFIAVRLVVSLAAMATAFKAATVAATGFNFALKAGPLGVILTALSLVGVGIVALTNRMSESERQTKTWLERMKEAKELTNRGQREDDPGQQLQGAEEKLALLKDVLDAQRTGAPALTGDDFTKLDIPIKKVIEYSQKAREALAVSLKLREELYDPVTLALSDKKENAPPRPEEARVFGQEAILLLEDQVAHQKEVIELLEKEMQARARLKAKTEEDALSAEEALVESEKAAKERLELIARQKEALEELFSARMFEVSLLGKTEEEVARLTAAREAEKVAITGTTAENKIMAAVLDHLFGIAQKAAQSYEDYAARVDKAAAVTQGIHDEIAAQNTQLIAMQTHVDLATKVVADLSLTEDEYTQALADASAAAEDELRIQEMLSQVSEEKRKDLADEIEKLRALAKERRNQERALQILIALGRKQFDDANKADKASEDLKKKVELLKTEIGMQGRNNAQTQAAIDLKKLELDLAENMTDKIRKLFAEYKKLHEQKLKDAALQPGKEQIASLKEEISLLKMSNVEREKRAALLSIRADAGLLPGEALPPELVAQVEQLNELIDELDWTRSAQAAVDGIVGAFSQGVEDILIDFNRLEDVGKQVFQSIMQEMIRLYVTSQLTKGLTSLFGGMFGSQASVQPLPGTVGPPLPNAQGNIFSGNSLIPFAQGGFPGVGMPEIIQGPTMFPMANNRAGIAGEAGPEWAIAPLKRTPKGDLGAEVLVKGGQAPATIVNQSVTFVTKDYDSFRKNQHQFRGDMLKFISR